MPFQFSRSYQVEAFRVGVARAIMIVTTLTVGAIIAAGAAGLMPVPAAHQTNNIAFVILCLFCLATSWVRPARTKTVTLVFFTGLLGLMASACILVKDDPWRFGWLYPGVGGAFLVLGRRGGVLWSFGAVGVLVVELCSGSLPLAAIVRLVASLFTTAAIFGLFAWRATVTVDNLAIAANRDPLTDLPNRRAFDEVLDRALASDRGFALIAVDLDRFKAINDTHGHATGDLVLIGVARALAAAIPPTGFTGRIGGEEFGVILPDADEKRAVEIAERLRSAVERAPSPVGTVTASFGVAATVPPHGSADAIFRRADAGLYSSKRAGRNRVVALPRAA